MKNFLAICTALMLVSAPAMAKDNKPCSGKKGGVSHCSGDKFVCKDGSISKSKRVCR
nr:MAG TPA: hypothetical protein [Caudoviricetes sp.]